MHKVLHIVRDGLFLAVLAALLYLTVVTIFALHGADRPVHEVRCFDGATLEVRYCRSQPTWEI